MGGLIITVCAPLQSILVYDSPFPRTISFVSTAVLGTLFGALAGLLGRRFGQMLRHLAPAKETSARETSAEAASAKEIGHA